MNKEDPEKSTDLDVFITCITNIGAGSDTTSINLTSILYYLIKEPRCFEKVQSFFDSWMFNPINHWSQLRAEIDENDAAGKLSSSVMFKETQRLPYLRAVIKEALRLHPASGVSLGRVVPKGGVEIAGYYFPEQASPNIFGSDTECSIN